jgi:hypothetical protein
MAYRNKTYVCFDADTDMLAYGRMLGWKENDRIDFDFHNAHELNNLRDGSNEETIKRKLRERLNGTKLLIVLIGENTKNLHKFVRWEMEIALNMGIPIVACYLDESRKRNDKLCPAIIRDELVLHIPYKQVTIKWAVDNWPSSHFDRKSKGDKKGIILNDAWYKNQGL